MKHVGILEAQTQLSALVDEVASGNEVTIMRDGKPAARLVPTLDEVTPEIIARRLEVVERIRARAKLRGQNFSHEEIKSWIEDGRH